MSFIFANLILFFLILPSTCWAGDCSQQSAQLVWTMDQVAALASQKFSCEELAQAIALAYAESGFRPYCVSSEGSSLLLNYSEDTGLWQMNDLRRNLEFEFGAGPPYLRNSQAHDCGLNPQCNFDYTYRLWLKDKGFTAKRWHAFNTRSYQDELVVARQFIKDHPQYAKSCHN